MRHRLVAGRLLAGRSPTGRLLTRRLLLGLVVLGLVATAVPAHAGSRSRRSSAAAAWLSVAHPGLGEYYNAGWGLFFDHCPQKKFWLGFIPLYGWPGYLQILSAIDAGHGRTSDNLTPLQ